MRVIAPAEPVVALADVKADLRVDHSDPDSVIQAQIDPATSQLDGYSGVLGRCLVSQTWGQISMDFRLVTCACHSQTFDLFPWPIPTRKVSIRRCPHRHIGLPSMRDPPAWCSGQAIPGPIPRTAAGCGQGDGDLRIWGCGYGS